MGMNESGSVFGLDTSVILKWLQHDRNYEVITFTADIGQGEEVESARAKAEKLGVEHIFIENLCRPFVQDYVFPMFRANAVYEGEYLLGTSIARPLIAKRMVEIARQTGATAVAHGATGKGNDQVRFELGVAAIAPELDIIAPWREWSLDSREDLLAYANEHDIAVDNKRKDVPPYSMDANLLHISYEGNVLEDPWQAPPDDMWLRTKDPGNTPDQAKQLNISFEQGDPVAIDGKAMPPEELLHSLNAIGGEHGIGRADLVENRYVGIKSRGCYETPGGTILLHAHRAIESITLDREAAHIKDSIMPKYAEIIYNGYWWSPERQALQALIDQSQQNVSGEVRLRLHKGQLLVTGRKSERSLYNQELATFAAGSGYDQKDAAGFIKLHALRLRTNA
ncbi:MAG: argininosuccinate synthase, partial [Candidatus Porifericomitaceae bacterium WSBS_2022_MAG_OTU9]